MCVRVSVTCEDAGDICMYGGFNSVLYLGGCINWNVCCIHLGSIADGVAIRWQMSGGGLGLILLARYLLQSSVLCEFLWYLLQ